MKRSKNGATFPYQRIVLTGAGSGIGQALLAQLAAYGVRIVAVDIDRDRLDRAVKMLEPGQAEIRPFVADVARQESLDELFCYALEVMQGIDLFIANAGFAYYERIETADWDRLEQIYRVNVFSPIYTAIKMKTISRGRPYKVVITASAMSEMALPGYAIYAGTKAALHRFAEGYRFELEDPGALALVYPIATRTNFFDAAARRRIPVPWPNQSPEQVAQAIISGIRQNRASIYPSPLFRISLLLERFVPILRKLVQIKERRQLEQWLAAARSGDYYE